MLWRWLPVFRKVVMMRRRRRWLKKPSATSRQKKTRTATYCLPICTKWRASASWASTSFNISEKSKFRPIAKRSFLLAVPSIRGGRTPGIRFNHPSWHCSRTGVTRAISTNRMSNMIRGPWWNLVNNVHPQSRAVTAINTPITYNFFRNITRISKKKN